MGLAGLSLPPIMLGVVAVALAAVALFFLPTLAAWFLTPSASNGPSGGPGGSSAVATATPAPTAIPEPTQQIYVVQANDTMSKIANRFGVPLQTLIDANRTTIPNPDRIAIGDQVIIPATTPTALPGVEASPSASP
jgi:LysM repeat protein